MSKRLLEPQRFTCDACGEEWERPAARGQRPRWCPSCRPTTGSLDPLKICVGCGLAGVRKDADHCSRECGVSDRERRRPLRRPPVLASPSWMLPASHPTRRAPLDSGRRWVAGRCRRCETPFIVIDQLTSSYCSQACVRLDAKLRRRALQRNAFVEKVYRRRVFAREGWRCHLCGKRCSRTARAPHPRAATLDHVVPLERGGDHSMANVRCAHFLCNSIKGNGFYGVEQLMLVG